MQSLDYTTANTSVDFDQASLVLDTVLLGMRAVRKLVRKSKPQGVSVAQFRVLTHLSHHEGASLSHLAEHSGLSLPSMSKAVDHLVKQGLASRQTSEVDRRRVTIRLTEEGQHVFHTVDDAIRAHIAELLSGLSDADRAEVVRGIGLLRSLLEKGRGQEQSCHSSGGPC